jgi:hypothetical protein
LLNPTVSFQVGDIARLPVPNSSSLKLGMLVEQAIQLAQTDSEENETTYDFIAPPCWEAGIDDVAQRHQKQGESEQEIDEEVYCLYDISDEDRAAIEAELAELTLIRPATRKVMIQVPMKKLPTWPQRALSPVMNWLASGLATPLASS